MNIIGPTEEWPSEGGVNLPLFEIVQSGIGKWNERTGGWPTDLLLGDYAMGLLANERVEPGTQERFSRPDQPLCYCNLLVCAMMGEGVRMARGLPDEKAAALPGFEVMQKAAQDFMAAGGLARVNGMPRR